MRNRAMKSMLVAVLGLCTPSLAGALDVSARAGFLTLRTDEWNDSQPQRTDLHFDLDLALDARGFVSQRDLGTWKLGVAYRRLWDDRTGRPRSLRESIFYDGRVSLFGGRRSALAFSLDGNRSQSEFSTGALADVTGRTIIQTTGAQAVVRITDRPVLTSGYRYVDVESEIPGLDRRAQHAHRINAETAFGTSAFNAHAAYLGDLSDGSVVSDRYSNHTVSVNASVPLADRTELIFDERFQSYAPRDLVPGAFRHENNAFRALVRNGGNFGDRQYFAYSAIRLLTEAATPPLREVSRQSLRYEGDLLLTDPGLFTRWTLDAALNVARAGDTKQTSSGETAGVQLWWRRETGGTVYEAAAGPLVGLVQPENKPDRTGFGALAHARLQLPWASHTLSGSYDLRFASDLYGSEGQSLTQGLSATLSGALPRGAYAATLTASAFRISSPLLGDGAGRTVELSFTARHQDNSLEARTRLTSGLDGATHRDFAGDGLLIPAPYDSHSWQSLVVGRAGLFSGLTATAQFRYLRSVRPGQPDQDQTELLGSLQYAYGGLVLAVEDRVDWFGQAQGGVTTNQVMFRVYRQLAW